MLGRGLVAAAAVVLLDQLSKLAVLQLFAGRGLGQRSWNLTSFFDLVLTFNRGVSFGFFNDGAGPNRLLFSLVALAIIAVLMWWLSRITHPLLAVAIGMIIGGAIGNVIDRLRFPGVVDFLYFHLPVAACKGGGTLLDGCWPAFNLADSAICVGVAAMLLDGLLLHREAH